MYVEVDQVDKHFGDYHALDNISFSVERGKLVALLGPSGSGKTTILRIIAGLEAMDSGHIAIDGTIVDDIPGSKRGIGFVFQNYALFRYMNVWDNIAFGLKVKKTSPTEVKDRVGELIELIGLSGMEQRFPNQLSGGQRQRVAFARALAPRPQVLLLDEPFAAIDAKVRSELRLWLREMIDKLGITSIFVTHDQEEALEVSDEIIVMSDGRIEQVGSPTEIYETPKTGFVARFAGNAPIIENYDVFNGFAKDNPHSRAVIRPEFVEAFRADNPEYEDMLSVAQPCIVENIAFRGFYYEVTLNVSGTTLTTHRMLDRRRDIATGMPMHVLVTKAFIVDDDNHVEIRINPLLRKRS